MKQKTDILCPFCGSDKVIKYGTSRDNVQRYKCKNEDCKRTFLETKKRIKYTSKEKALLSLLKNFLEPSDDENITIKSAIKNINENSIDIRKFNLVQRSVSDNDEIQCYRPKILICEEFDTITIYRFNNRLSRNCSSRTISIVDDDKNSKYKNVVKTKLEKDKKAPKITAEQYAFRKADREIHETYEKRFMRELKENSCNNFYDDPQDYY